MLDLVFLVTLMIGTGLLGGLLAGLLGVGGGIIIVPVLEFALGFAGIDPALRMKVAVATSLATIAVTSISSARTHRAKGAVDEDVVALWRIPVIAGAVLGVLIASAVNGGVLAAVFGTVALIVTIKMLLPLDGVHLTPEIPRGAIGTVPPFAVGIVSAMMGIGGGTLSVPVMTLLGEPIHRAVGTGSVFGLLISVPATIGFVALGLGVPGLPPLSLGYVNLIGFAILVPATWVAAPYGARLAHRLKPRHLSITFGLFLSLVAARMLWRALHTV